MWFQRMERIQPMTSYIYSTECINTESAHFIHGLGKDNLSERCSFAMKINRVMQCKFERSGSRKVAIDVTHHTICFPLVHQTCPYVHIIAKILLLQWTLISTCKLLTQKTLITPNYLIFLFCIDFVC